MLKIIIIRINNLELGVQLHPYEMLRLLKEYLSMYFHLLSWYLKINKTLLTCKKANLEKNANSWSIKMAHIAQTMLSNTVMTEKFELNLPLYTFNFIFVIPVPISAIINFLSPSPCKSANTMHCEKV